MINKFKDNKEFHEFISKREPNIAQIVAMKDEKIIFSDTWQGYKEKDAMQIASITKSVIAILIGIAIDKGLIKSVNQKVLDFFPDYVTKRGEKTIQNVKLYHLMAMTAPYKYKSEPWTKVSSSDDWTKAALDLLGGRKGITGEFKYSTAGIQILSTILSKVSDMTTLEFANKYLFGPLGIEKRKNCFALGRDEIMNFLKSNKPREKVWLSDPQGMSVGGYGLCLSAEEMCKIGQVCLNNGKWKGKKIVSEKWIDEISKIRVNGEKTFNNFHYGYLWWVIDDKSKIYSAIGDSGNVIYVNKINNVSIATSCTFKPSVLDRIETIIDYIEPFVLENK